MFKKRNSIKINPSLNQPIQNRSIFVSLFRQLFITLAISFISLFTFLSITSYLEKKPLTPLTFKSSSSSFLPDIKVMGEETSNPSQTLKEEEFLSQSSPLGSRGDQEELELKSILSSCHNCLQGKHIQDSAIDSSEIQNKSILSSDIKTGQINSRTIEDFSIQRNDLIQSLQDTINQEESDPIFSSWNKSTGITITESQITNLQSYLTSISGLNISLLTNNSGYITDGNTNWNNEYSFITASTSDTLTNKAGNISMWTNDSGYLTSYIETDPIFSAWNKSTGITIQESQISDLQTYLTDLSTLTTDNLTQGTTNKYTQWNTNTTNLSYTTGNVGIGTTTPTEKLEVAGNIKSSNYIGSGNRCVYVDLNGVLRVKSEDCGTSSGGDNLGNHTLTQNMILGSNWISGDGDNEGFQISSTGILSGAQGNISMWTNNSGYITDGNTNWDNSYGFLTSYTETDPIFSAWDKSTGISITESQISNLQSYLTSYTETDPIFSSSQANNITASHLTILGNTSNTNTGDETQSSIQTKLGTATTTTSGYLTSTDWNIFNSKQPAGSYLTGTKVDSFNTRTGAVTLSSSDVTTALTFTPYNATNPAGYISSYTETDPVFSSWNKSTGISITESQISDLQTYLTNLSTLTTDNLTQGTTNLYSQWATSGSNISFVGGNVGIGTTSPASLLNIAGTTVSIRADATTGGAELRLSSAVNGADWEIITNDATDFGANTTLGFWGGGAARMAITNTGNVGIGTTGPASKLAVSGGATFGSTYSATAMTDGSLAISGNLGIGTTVPGAKLDVSGNIKISNDSAGTLVLGRMDNVNEGGEMVFNGAGSYDNWSIDSNQNNLRVLTSSANANYLYINNVGAGTAGLIVNDGGIGIGMTPGHSLDVNGTISSATGQIELATSAPVVQTAGNDATLIFRSGYNTGPKLTLVGPTAATRADTISFTTNGGASLNVLSNGNVGIGTTGPASKLAVSGGATFGSTYSATAMTDGSLAISGNVGIGTTGPDYALRVQSGAVAGNGAYVNLASHSSKKENFESVSVLGVISQLNIQEWQYKPEYALGDNTRHLYPFADDFFNKFGLGKDEWRITAEDMAGVALKGIQELDLKTSNQIAGLTDNQNQITAQITGQLANQTVSIEDKIEFIGVSLDKLTTGEIVSIKDQIIATNDQIDLANSGLDSVNSRVDLLESALGFDPDKPKNFSLLGTLSASKLTAGIFEVKNETANNKTLGDVTLCPSGEVFNDNDNCELAEVNEINVSDGKTLEIKTTAISANTKIFVSPIGKNPVSWILDNIQEGIGFEIILSEETSQPIKFNWWIVEEK